MMTCCPTCGASDRSYSLPFSISHRSALDKLAHRSGPAWRSELDLTGPEYSKLAQLRYWGLARAPRRGWWELTEHGRDFLAGRVSVPSVIHVKRNVVVGTEGEPVFAHASAMQDAA